MTISVVIPAYNEEKYLPKTLMSIAKLERKPDEVVVIDGGSTDKTAQVTRKYGAKPIIVQHRGIGYARQKGLEAAKSNVIAFTDADTQVPPDWLTKIIETLQQEGVVGVYGPYYVRDGPILYQLFIKYLNPIIFSLVELMGTTMAPGQNIAFWRKKALSVGGFPIDFRSVEDIEMVRRLKKIGKVVYRRDNPVLSSGRRGNEGLPALFRTIKGFIVYYLTGKANKFTFPDIR